MLWVCGQPLVCKPPCLLWELLIYSSLSFVFFFQAEDGIRDSSVTGVQTCALPISTEALLLGIYEKALPALDAALERHLRDTNPLSDAPSVRVIRFARLEIADMLEIGRASCRERV